MRAYKCDRCGRYFENFDRFKDTKVCLSILVAGRWTTADLCRYCYLSMESWYMVHKLSKEEVDYCEMDEKTIKEVQADVRLEETEEDET